MRTYVVTGESTIHNGTRENETKEDYKCTVQRLDTTLGTVDATPPTT